MEVLLDSISHANNNLDPAKFRHVLDNPSVWSLNWRGLYYAAYSITIMIILIHMLMITINLFWMEAVFPSCLFTFAGVLHLIKLNETQLVETQTVCPALNILSRGEKLIVTKKSDNTTSFKCIGWLFTVLLLGGAIAVAVLIGGEERCRDVDLSVYLSLISSRYHRHKPWQIQRREVLQYKFRQEWDRLLLQASRGGESQRSQHPD